MKELEKHNRDPIRQEIESVEEKKQQQEYKYIESLNPKAGHSLFEINHQTGKVKKADFVKKKVITWNEVLKIYNGEESNHKEIIVNKNCSYISALNAENAMERYRLNKGSAKMRERQSMDF